MNNLTMSERREQWKAMIDEQEQCGLTQDEFCKKHNISLAKFSYYRTMFRGKKPQHQRPLAMLSPVNVTKLSSSNELRLILPNGFQCIFPIDTNPMRIKELLGVFLS